MEPVEWLRSTVPGFDDLSEDERRAIGNFSIIWSLFEGSVLNGRGSVRALTSVVDELRQRNTIDLAPLNSAIDHFRGRYFANDTFTTAFDQHLHFRPQDQRPVAEAFVSGQANDEAAILKGL